ncbi:MAG: protein kinase, partial [Acidobacteria bacterium]|nr:protein kinase [Acidobacteriota bacterium]
AEALAIARQIAEALEAAHEKGIIHRDLKPGNVKVTPEGVVKVLDFGLAKAVERSSGGSGADSPTLTMRATEVGLILGTAGYMSPEQAAGKAVDRRADIWAFGVVLYELVTGKRLFDGETVTHTLADVVRAPIDLSVIEDGQVRGLIARCLDRNLRSRLAHIAEARIAIEKYAPAQAVAVAPGKAGWWPWVAGVFALVSLVTGVLLFKATRPAELGPLIRLDMEIPPGTPLPRVSVSGRNFGHMFALSPDGARLAVSLRGADGKVRLYTRLLQQSQFTPLAGTENGYSPFFSPAGDWIGFFADGKMKKVAVEGGAAVTLCDASRCIAALNVRGVLSRVPAAGGTPVPVTKLNAGEATHRWPQVLPGSQAVLFTAAAQTGAGYDDANIEVISLQSGERKTLHEGGFFSRYVTDANGPAGTGHLVYLRQSTLFAVPFYVDRLAVAGTPAPILEHVGSARVAGGDFAFARNGTFVYLAGKADVDVYPISWVDRGGKMAQPLRAAPGGYFTPRFSPDGKRLVFAMASGKGRDIWVKDLDRDIASRLRFLPGVNNIPVWTPDGKNIVFRSENQATPGLYAIRADGAGEAKRLTEGGQYATSFSPDGKRLAIFKIGNGGSNDLFTLPVEADSVPGGVGLRLGKAELFLGTPFLEVGAVFSPDGRWLAYQSNESGTVEVCVRPFLLRGGGRWQVSTRGGRFPVWCRDGRELLFLNSDSRVMAAGYTAKGDTFLAGKPRVWTEARMRGTGNLQNYDIAPDGKRLAAMVADEEEGKLPTSLTFLLNFGDELRRKAPGGQ